ncbi:VOC family protein [Bacillus infantis]|uniref:VOC family protein n=1 Tax=Bacillus infantis TaxID=324767 RepID=A0A5D4R8B7_9BACI|nr:VOC family protein [Bacillus infantis]TYS46870.1 VOC family protein [Bacillus infantis]
MAGKRIDHIGVMVKNIEKSIEFYTNTVGMVLKAEVPHSNGVIKLAFLGFSGNEETELELIQGYNDHLPEEGMVHHFAVGTDDVEGEFTRLKELGTELIDQEITTLPNGYKYFFFYGPDREWIEFFQR